MLQYTHAQLCFAMVKRTSPSDALKVVDADDLDDVVQDKREVWRASKAKANRRDRRYKNLLTRELKKLDSSQIPSDSDHDEDEG